MNEPDEDVFHARIQRRRDRRQFQVLAALVAVGVIVFLMVISNMR